MEKQFPSRNNAGSVRELNPCFKFIPIVYFLAVLLLLPCLSGLAEDSGPDEMSSAFLVSPLVGPVKSEVDIEGRPGSPSRTLTDTSPEYGLFLMYANPRVVINNTLFNTDVNDSMVWGNITTINLYGDPSASVTWHLGSSYLWHSIDGDTVDVIVTEPLAKAGVLFRLPAWHLSINPYLGYGWQNVDTTVDTPRMSIEDNERTESRIYGVSVYWRWRMLYANAKYYREDNQDLDEQFHVFRLWATAMFTKRAGIMTRFEYSEQSSSTDTSVLFGPVVVF